MVKLRTPKNPYRSLQKGVEIIKQQYLIGMNRIESNNVIYTAELHTKNSISPWLNGLPGKIQYHQEMKGEFLFFLKKMFQIQWNKSEITIELFISEFSSYRQIILNNTRAKHFMGFCKHYAVILLKTNARNRLENFQGKFFSKFQILINIQVQVIKMK